MDRSPLVSEIRVEDPDDLLVSVAMPGAGEVGILPRLHRAIDPCWLRRRLGWGGGRRRGRIGLSRRRASAPIPSLSTRQSEYQHGTDHETKHESRHRNLPVVDTLDQELAQMRADQRFRDFMEGT